MNLSPRMFCGRHHDLLIVTEYLDLCQSWPRICFFCRSHNPVRVNGFLAWVTRWVPPVERDLLIIQKHIIHPWCLKVDQSLLYCIVLYCIVLYCILYCIVLYCIVWYGMVWYCMVWYGMVWYGMVWYRRSLFVLLSFFIWPQCCMSFWLTLFHSQSFLIVFCVWFHIK